jgi:hypothetical protein
MFSGGRAVHCGRYQPRPISRRDLLSQAALGFGGVALASLWGDEAYGRVVRSDDASPLTPVASHFPARAKSVIFLYMDGGVSQVDSFDPKPLLEKEHGQKIKLPVQPTQFDSVGAVLKSPWKFQRYGESGLPVSDLFPHIGSHADDLAVIRSMTSDFSEHTNANYFFHSGIGIQGRPSMGAWFTYGLGSESQNLPGFVVLNSGMIPPGGVDCFTSGFLPASYQGSLFRGEGEPISDLKTPAGEERVRDRKLRLLARLDEQVLSRYGQGGAVESAIANYELAFRMQTAVPDLVDVSTESQATQALYGIDDPATAVYGRQCLIARRLVERGVRFVQLLCQNLGHDRWDQHGNLVKGHGDNARAVDKPIAGLLADLKSRGLLEETLIVWSGEFGRTPMAQGNDGRDHNPFGFSMWMAGGGVKGGTTHGATDEYGYYAVENKLTVHDLHATMLHLAGMDHTKLTYRFGGRDFRLTDVYGEVIEPILA